MPRLLDTNENTRDIVWHLYWYPMEKEKETYILYKYVTIYTFRSRVCVCQLGMESTLNLALFS